MALSTALGRKKTKRVSEYRTELEREAEVLKKKRLKYDNAAILTKFEGALLQANMLLTEFAEEVLGNSKIVFQTEMRELNEVVELFSIYEKKEQTHQTKLKKLEKAQNDLEVLKEKFK